MINKIANIFGVNPDNLEIIESADMNKDWKYLTDEEIIDILNSIPLEECSSKVFANAIQEALKEKNAN